MDETPMQRRRVSFWVILEEPPKTEEDPSREVDPRREEAPRTKPGGPLCEPFAVRVIDKKVRKAPTVAERLCVRGPSGAKCQCPEQP